MKQLYLKSLVFFLFLLIKINTFAYNCKIDGIYYNLSGEKAIVTYGNGYSSYGDKSIVIPETITYKDKIYTVTEIGNYAFADCWYLPSVVIPNTVTSIGNYSFRNCNSIRSITIGSNITRIGANAFEHLANLHKVIIPDISSWCNISFENELSNPFCTYTSWGKVDRYIDESTEADDKIVIPDGVLSINSYAFSRFPISSITIPKSLTQIESNAFAKSNINQVFIEDLAAWLNINFEENSNPLEIAGHLLFNGKEITDLIIPEDIQNISNYAFSGCIGLNTVVFNNKLSSIGNHAFKNCTGLSFISIPNNIESIDQSVFTNCI